MDLGRFFHIKNAPYAIYNKTKSSMFVTLGLAKIGLILIWNVSIFDFWKWPYYSECISTQRQIKMEKLKFVRTHKVFT